MIYFLSAKTSEGSRIKVGWTTEFERRLSAIRRGNACQIEVIGVIAGTEEQEKELHAEIGEDRDHHEWYYDSPELRQWIARQMYPEGPVGSEFD
jgi:hypothetical protein